MRNRVIMSQGSYCFAETLSRVPPNPPSAGNERLGWRPVRRGVQADSAEHGDQRALRRLQQRTLALPALLHRHVPDVQR